MIVVLSSSDAVQADPQPHETIYTHKYTTGRTIQSTNLLRYDDFL